MANGKWKVHIGAWPMREREINFLGLTSILEQVITPDSVRIKAAWVKNQRVLKEFRGSRQHLGGYLQGRFVICHMCTD